MLDLNNIGLPTDGGSEPQEDHRHSAVGNIEAVFKNHRARLIEEISKYPIIVGCVAWLTDYAVLDALASRDGVAIVVQKEDFLKPDSGATNRRLNNLYAALPVGSRMNFPYLGQLSYASDPTCDPIRCVGNHNSDKKAAWPRMHNKFLVFCDYAESSQPDGWWPPHIPQPRHVVAKKVWTGSYNISDNASRSWENAVLIDAPVIADVYAREFAQIFSFSERLDWTSKWVAPEYRFGS